MSQRAAAARELLAWFDRRARDLPWRRTRDPYAIWVSEIMLQQTRVDTVIPYYERFLARFPTPQALADAEVEEVLRHWSGLGYYRRARQLHLAAGEVVARYGGELPDSAEKLTDLPGIGRYTAGAIASIAHGEATPVVDGNVIRVLSRYCALEGDMRSQKGQKEVWARAAELLDEARPGDFNQAVMELGATVCTPRQPSCAECPLALGCRARREGRVEELPRLAPKKKPRREPLQAAVVTRADRVLLAQRGPDGLFAGLWEPPMIAVGDGPLSLRALGIASALALQATGEVRHVLSHLALEIAVHHAEAPRAFRLPRPPAGVPYVAYGWRRPAEVPLSTLARKVLAAPRPGAAVEASA
ncbi:MAG: A/G-specific adenine glycosylase [Polyangiaceae bacterium]